MDLTGVTWRKASYSGDNGGACVEVAAWHKASYSGGNGGACVEVGAWHKASYSGGNGGECVEIASTGKSLVAIRDSKDPNGPNLAFTPSGWQSFIRQVRNRTLGLG